MRRSVGITHAEALMRRLSLSLLALPVCLALTGCYYDPGYGYVRNGTGADAYYGTQTTTTVVGGGVGYYDGPDYGYYGYGGCCYGGTTVIYRDAYGRRYDGDRYGHGRPPPGGWNNRPGRGDGDGHGRPPPPGGWGSRGDDHRPPPGGWRNGDRSPPQGGWRNGDRPQSPPGGWRGNRPSPPSNMGGGQRPQQGSPGHGDRGGSRGRSD